MRRVPALVAVVLCVAGGAAAQDRAVPEGAIAWWRFEPAAARDKPALPLVGPGIALVGAERPDVDSFAGLLLAGLRSGLPHSFALLDMRQDAKEGSPVETEFSMVLEIRSEVGHDRCVEQIESGMRERGAPGRTVDPASGRHAMLYGASGGSVLGACSTPGAFLLARGEGTLPKWFDGSASPDDSLAHERAERDAHPPGRVVFRSYVNLNLLRRALEPSGTFIDGTGAVVLRACGLANGRSIMLHARRLDPAGVPMHDPVLDLLPARGARGAVPVYSGPALLALDGTWSARSNPPGEVGRAQLTEGFWPGDGANRLHMPPPAADLIAVARIDRDRAATALDAVLAAAPSMLPREGAAKYPARLGEWRREHNGALQRTLHSLGGWLVVAYAGERPGVLMAYLELKQGVEEPRFGADVLDLLTPVADRLNADRNTSTWTLPVGSPGRGVVAWTIARARASGRPVLIAALDLSVLGGGAGAADGTAAREAARAAREAFEAKH